MTTIGVASDNQLKVDAVREVFQSDPAYADAHVIGVRGIPSGVGEMPLSFSETMRGAQYRASRVMDQENCDIGVGLEAGLMEVPLLGSYTGCMNFTACVIRDSDHFYPGLSSAFEWPRSWINRILTEGMTVNEAARAAGFVGRENLAHEEGAIGILSGGHLTRKEYLKQAVQTAFMQLSNKPLYRRSILCTVCSREKLDGTHPARELYLGSHIRVAEAEAARLQLPFYILSGVWGLQAADEKVTSYDHQLQASEVETLAAIIRNQLMCHDISVIHFHVKLSHEWLPYYKALMSAATTARAIVHVHEL